MAARCRLPQAEKERPQRDPQENEARLPLGFRRLRTVGRFVEILIHKRLVLKPVRDLLVQAW